MRLYAEAALELIYPSRCRACRRLTPNILCDRCAPLLPIINGPICRVCGKPSQIATASCRECHGRRLYFTSARAAWVYTGVARELVQAYKFANEKALAARLAQYLVPLAPEADLVTWVPLTLRKTLFRGYNQAYLLAKHLAGALDLPIARLLHRLKATEDQNRLDMRARKSNVKGVFGLKSAVPFNGKRLILVDDVYTTGSTVSECARELSRAGAAEVHVVTLARTLLDV